ncbi:MAG: molybdenum cofactor biosynthesis protein MoaE [Myxococcota bacterium]|nr:molybdenum cofactor biosynthesis protein MoaE [Myxococcota bacterium]
MSAGGAGTRVGIERSALSAEVVAALVRRPGAGAIVVFEGTVRDVNDGRAVVLLEYESYEAMALAEMERIASELERELGGDVRVAARHRIGALSVGDVAVICAASAPHRTEAFEACRALIDRIKERVPIWKREHGPDGAYWVGWEDARCTPGHRHE